MKLTKQYDYPADPTTVFALIADETFRRESCERMADGPVVVEIAETAEGGVDVRIERTVPAEVPDFVKKLVGDSITAVQTEKWSAAADDGSRTADITMDIKGQPAQMRGTASVSPSGDGTSFAVDGDVKVAIPLIGKRIEPEVAKAVEQSLDADVEFGISKL